MLLVSLFAALPTTLAAQRIKVHKPSHNEKPFYLYAKGSFLHKRGREQEAAYTFKELNALKPPTSALDTYISHLYDTYQFSAVVSFAETIKTTFKENWELQLLLAQAYLFLNMDSKAEELFCQLRQKMPFNEQVLYYSVLHQLKQNKAPQALAMLNEFLEKADLRPKHALFYFLKSKVLLSMNKAQESLESIEKSIELYPQFDKGWLLKAVLMEQMGKISDAINGYQRFLSIVQSDATIEKQLVSLLFSQKRYDEAASTLRNIQSDQPDYYFDLALLEWKAGHYTAAEKEISSALAKNPQFEKARLLRTEILLAQNKQEEAVKKIEAWVMLTPDNNTALHALLLLRQTAVSKGLILESLSTLVKAHPSKKNILLALADTHHEKKNFKLALAYYDRVLKTNCTPTLKSNILTQMAHIYFHLNSPEKMEKTLESVVKSSKELPTAYNLLAYLYADHKKNLDKALTLVNKALEAQPNSPHFLDTKAYVYLQMGKKQEALPLLRKALAVAPNDAVIKQRLQKAAAH